MGHCVVQVALILVRRDGGCGGEGKCGCGGGGGRDVVVFDCGGGSGRVVMVFD